MSIIDKCRLVHQENQDVQKEVNSSLTRVKDFYEEYEKYVTFNNNLVDMDLEEERVIE